MNYGTSVGTRLSLAFAGVIVVFAGAIGLSIGRLAAFNTAVTEITTRELASRCVTRAICSSWTTRPK
jgi:ABC-type dipeptide/oligopeptide/nickel transport system permease subunit